MEQDSLLVMRFIKPSHVTHAAWKPADYNGRCSKMLRVKSVLFETIEGIKVEIDCESTCGIIVLDT
jgi:hypothetical protein